MLQKMGWNPGEGLGKNKEGQIEPLVLDVKMDKKGLTAQEEMTPRKTPIPLAKSLAGKHPVSALVEICSKRKWPPPEFEIVFDCGPDHKKNFLMKVHVNSQTYKPAIAASTKKIAKANAAAACLQALGLIPKDPPPKPQGTLHTIPQPQPPSQPQGAAHTNSQPQPPLQTQGTVHTIPQPQAPSQTPGTVHTIPHSQPLPHPQETSHNIPQSQPSPSQSLSVPLPPPSAPPSTSTGDVAGSAGPPGEGANACRGGTPAPSAGVQPVSPKDAPVPPMGSQPVIYPPPPPMGGLHYGGSNPYAANAHFEQLQYFGGPYQRPPY